MAPVNVSSNVPCIFFPVAAVFLDDFCLLTAVRPTPYNCVRFYCVVVCHLVPGFGGLFLPTNFSSVRLTTFSHPSCRRKRMTCYDLLVVNARRAAMY